MPKPTPKRIVDVATKALTRLTNDGLSATATFTADSKHVVFTSSRGGHEAVWWQPVDGTGVAEQLFDTKDNAQRLAQATKA